MRVVIVGGGAGGASCAARLRRLNDKAEILILEKTNETSIASCGLPYFIGGVIAERDKMQVAKPEVFKNLFNIDIKHNAEVVALDSENKQVKTADGNSYSYDKLVLATGAKPFVPNIKGLDNIAHFVVKNLADADKIKDYIAVSHPKNAVVIGGGFIGVEVAENLAHLGLDTSLVELSKQILPPLDTDMVKSVQKEMEANGVKLYLGKGLQEVSQGEIILTTGESLKADMLVLAMGIRPDTAWLTSSGLKMDERGAILTNDYMRTNLADVYACGDSVSVRDFVSGEQTMIALAGPANRQGRLIADNIMEKGYAYKATQGTGIVKVFNLTAAFTGNNEKQLANMSMPYKKMVIMGNSHAGYYPNAKDIMLKVLFDEYGRILGAQAVGEEGIDKRIDVIATIMRLGGTTRDLRDAELCYAPPYAGAKDAINMIGMAIENVRDGLVKSYFGTEFPNMFVLDVRPPEMYQAEHIDGAVNIPAAQIRKRLNELPKDKTIMVHCVKGYTSYVVARILMQNGFDNVLSYAGGWTYYKKQK